MRWPALLTIISLLFFISSFFINDHLVFAYRWMSLGMAFIDFLYYLIIRRYHNRGNPKMIGSTIAAITIKFCLSGLLVIVYLLIDKEPKPIVFLFFFIAYFVFSAVSYIEAYNYK